MTQSELAAASTTSRATISRLELGDGAIGSDALWELAAAMGTTPSALYARASRTTPWSPPSSTPQTNAARGQRP